MAPAPPSPSGEAIELLSNAAQAWLDGPVAFLRAAADRASDPSSTADTAAADLIGFGAQAAKAWFGGLNAIVGAIAVAGILPRDGHRFVVTVPSATFTRQVRIVTTSWTWLLDPQPPGQVVAVWPPAILQPGATRVSIIAKPLVLEPSWDIELELTAPGTAPTRVTVSLDSSSELKPEEPWPGAGAGS